MSKSENILAAEAALAQEISEEELEQVAGGVGKPTPGDKLDTELDSLIIGGNPSNSPSKFAL